MADLNKLKRENKITDYAERLGFHLVNVGNWYSLKEHDSVRIDPVKNVFYRNSTGQAGSIIDFLLAFTDSSLSEIVKELEKKGSLSAVNKEVVPGIGTGLKKNIKSFKLPEKADTYKNIYAYLTKTRKIDRKIIDRMIKDGYLYQDTHNNCVFISYRNGTPIFGSLRGTNTYKKFVADVPGSDYSHGFFIGGGGNKLYITESVIDLMSLIELLGCPADCDYLSLSGVKKDGALYHHLKNGYEKIILALDNDDVGLSAAKHLKTEIIKRGLIEEDRIEIKVPKNKDWNEDLLGLKEDK